MILLPAVLAKDPRITRRCTGFWRNQYETRNIMAGKGKRVEAVGYMRTSSAANAGMERPAKHDNAGPSRAMPRRPDGGRRLFYDAAVSGADAIEARPGFAPPRPHRRQRRPHHQSGLPAR